MEKVSESLDLITGWPQTSNNPKQAVAVAVDQTFRRDFGPFFLMELP